MGQFVFTFLFVFFSACLCMARTDPNLAVGGAAKPKSMIDANGPVPGLEAAAEIVAPPAPSYEAGFGDFTTGLTDWTIADGTYGQPGGKGRFGQNGSDGAAGRTGINGGSGQNGDDGTAGILGDDGQAGAAGENGAFGSEGIEAEK